MVENRQTWSSRLTYILAVAGATIGFGATWRFPYLVGQNGGGAYVLIFCIAMIVIGIPMILAENAIGRRLHINSVDAFGGYANGKKVNPLWKIVGWMGICGAFGIMTAIFVLINYIILVKGAVEGIEKAAKYLMPLLFILMLAMVARNVTLDGAIEGIKFYLTPDFSKISMKLFIDVLGQVFFALSLGFGVMITLSSFLRKDEDLIKTSVITGIVNTVIAVVAGFMIFPSLFTFGISPDSGPSLVFKSLPIVFSNMFAGQIMAIAFFGLLMIAALTTSLPIYEVIITVLEEKFKIKRHNAIVLVLSIIFVVGNIPSLMATNILSDITIFGKNIFDAYDAISATIFFVLTSLFCALFVGWVLKDEAKAEIMYGTKSSKTIVNIWFYYVKFVIPFIILVVFISSFYNNFLK
ncbi:sodium-dependent transporter [Campylobacter sp. P091]|uniref:sodium-dependent transporter n=1 Tax=Campylobacter sp. P091 TaxID=1895621 RepID=UPI000A348045|nr:sodium-dependent transporter [Campylobacter sp. P091]